MIAKAQSPVVIKMQGSWSATDIFNEMAMEFVTRVNEMAGGRLRVDYLVGGAVVKPFEVMDAVSKGVLDAGHTVPVYWYGKSKIASLFGSGPINGCDAFQTLAGIYRDGGIHPRWSAETDEIGTREGSRRKGEERLCGGLGA